MASIEDKLAGFSAIVLEEAKKKRAEIIKENDIKRKKAIEEKENEYLHNAYEDIQSAVAKHTKENNERVLKIEMAFKKELLLRREEMISEIFTNIEKRVVDFSKSGEYKAWLLKKLQSACDEVGKGEKTIYVTADDMKYKAEIEAEFENSVVEKSDDEQILGGALVYNNDRRVFVNYSLKQMIDDEKSLFLQTSGLTVG